MFDHFQRIYDEEAEAYDRLVGAEDARGSLGPALAALAPLGGARVLDVGTGTGRVAALLAEAGARVLGCDRAAAMLAVACDRGLSVLRADAVALPVANGAFDLAVAGWVFGHFTEQGDSGEKLDAALAEMTRAVRPGGALAILETMGSAVDTPAPPSEGLARYYARLEGLGFRRRVLATDYRFASVDEAARVCGWFFGPEAAARIRSRGWQRVPEWTALFALRR